MRFFNIYHPFWIYLIYVGVLIIPFIGMFSLFDWDEINFAESSREMLMSGNYFQVQINFEPFHEKPPFFFWLQSVSMSIFGVGEFGARFPNAILAVATLVVLFFVGSRIKDRNFAWIWSSLYIGAFLPNLYFRSGIIDPYFNLFIFLGIYFLYECFQLQSNKSYKKATYAGLFTGLALITKGPVGLLIIGLVYTIFFLLKWKFIKWVDFVIFTLVVFVVSLGWYGVEVWTKGIWFLVEFIKYQIELFSQPVAGHQQSIYYHFIVVFIGCFPFSIYGLRNCFRSSGAYSLDFEKLMRITFWVVMILFTIVSTKIIHYSSMAYFPLSFLAAQEIHRIYSGKKIELWKNLLIAFVGFLLPLLLIGLIFIFTYHSAWLSFVIKDVNFLSMLNQNLHFGGWEWVIPLLMLLATFVLLRMNKIGVIKSLFIFMVLTSSTFALLGMFVLPKVDHFVQGSAISFYQSISKEKKYVTTVGYKSYAHYFYAEVDMINENDSLFVQKNNILHEQFQDRSLNDLTKKEKNLYNTHLLNWFLNGDIDRAVYFVIKKNRPIDQLINNENIVKLYSEGNFEFYTRKLN